jgi:hypothetical protein
MVFYWPIICSGDVCKNKTLFDNSESDEPIVPETLGESAGLNETDIPGLCLTAVYQLLDEGRITIWDVHGAYTRAKERAISSQAQNS